MSTNQSRRAQHRHLERQLRPGNKGTPGPGRAHMRQSVRPSATELAMRVERTKIRYAKRRPDYHANRAERAARRRRDLKIGKPESRSVGR